MKFYVFIFTIISSIAAVAADAGGHGGGHGIDAQQIKTILFQTFNLAVLIAGLVYYLKTPISAYFKEKRAAYVAAADRANDAMKSAEKEFSDIKVRLNKLESTADESISRARAEAADMRNNLIFEAQAASKKLREEAESTARLEIEKAKLQLREQLLAEAIQASRSQMQSKVSVEDHKRLQGDFINNIQVVQQ